ncbi:hypothetical protein ES319_A10G137500v1 [Gossypium barbadense]|uniref:Uncharacterized protein n=3 Tax=Gossypium TaxID=3633 RepID=A0A5J5U2Q4_GOSBA|nr:hypothetical protein ES319_A10G137500v1 [Gossypium barbadense]TYG98874.1 hypothetical protein ES288_A10G151800v1 [Gossypium darwinii]TYI06312.1 hypothetical protein ES332_A10G149800v1 [Gossypium tomentosum]
MKSQVSVLERHGTRGGVTCVENWCWSGAWWPRGGQTFGGSMLGC